MAGINIVPEFSHTFRTQNGKGQLSAALKLLLLKKAAVGIEPTNKGFADLCLTTWLRRRVERVKAEGWREVCTSFILPPSPFRKRETGFEPATSTLARSHSTAELLPRERLKFY